MISRERGSILDLYYTQFDDVAEKAIAQFPREYQAVNGDGVQLADNDPRWKNLKMHVNVLEIIYK